MRILSVCVVILVAQGASDARAAPAPAAPLAMGSGPAETAEIMDGVTSCVNRVVPGDFDPAGFKADGWLPGGRRSASAGGVPVQHLFYGKQGGHVFDAVQITQHGSTSCLTIAALKSGDQIAEIRSAIAAEFEAQPFASFQGDDAFKAFVERTIPGAMEKTLLTPSHRFLIEETESASGRSVRIMTTPKRAER